VFKRSKSCPTRGQIDVLEQFRVVSKGCVPPGNACGLADRLETLQEPGAADDPIEGSGEAVGSPGSALDERASNSGPGNGKHPHPRFFTLGLIILFLRFLPICFAAVSDLPVLDLLYLSAVVDDHILF
jgi:hypothetical protein